MTEARITPARALRDRVEAMYQAGDRVAVVTDSDSIADRVLVAVRIPSAAFVMAIDRKEYDGLAVLRAAGFDTTPTPLPPPLPPRQYDKAGVPIPTTSTRQDKKS